MKMTKPHFDILQKEINNILLSNPEIVNDYEVGNFERVKQTHCLQTRFCFDMFHKVIDNLSNKEFLGELYEYLHDDHIYTALNKICPKLVKKF